MMLKQKLNPVLTLILFPLLTFATNPESRAYIQHHSQLAIHEMQLSGIPASIKLAQAILESAWGRSEAAVIYNSHFGIKCKDWRGDSFKKLDDDYDANGNLTASCFRAYLNAEQSFKDHTKFLRNSPRYRELFRYDRTDYVNWAIGLQRCGYATNPEYALKLIDLIEKYELYQYDKPIVRPQAIATYPPRPSQDATVATNAPRAESIPNQYDRITATENGTPGFEFNQNQDNATSTEQSLTVYQETEAIPSSYTNAPADINREVIVTFRPTYNKRYQQLSRRPRVSSRQRR